MCVCVCEIEREMCVCARVKEREHVLRENMFSERTCSEREQVAGESERERQRGRERV